MKNIFLILILTLFITAPLYAYSTTAKKYDQTSFNHGSPYDYDENDPPRICFFPVAVAKWDGYKITNKNWRQLTVYQKAMFVLEAIEEIEDKEDKIIDFNKEEEGSQLIYEIDNSVEILKRQKAQEVPILALLHQILEENERIKSKVSEKEKLFDYKLKVPLPAKEAGNSLNQALPEMF